MDGAWLREKKACLDYLITKKLPENRFGEASGIIHHVLWQHHPHPEVSPTHRHTEELGGTLGDTYRQPVEPMETATRVTLTQAQMAKMAMVLEMDSRQASQNEIIQTVWDVNPKDRAGQEGARELRLIRAYMAGQARRFLSR